MSAAPPGHPDPRVLDEAIDQVAAVLLRAKGLGAPWLSGAEISRILRDEYGIALHWKTIEAQISQHRDVAARRKRGGTWQFTLLAAGESRVTKAQLPITVVDPTAAVPATLALHGFLGSLTGPVRICDPYCDPATIEHLDACAPSTEIRLLTKNLRDTGTLRRLLVAAQQRTRLAVRIAASSDLHDRYIIDPSQMLILGGSLNGFGKKQMFVIRAGADIATALTADFDARWADAASW